MLRKWLKISLAILLALFLTLPLIGVVPAQEEKIVFRRLWGYNPPPVGHWNYFASGCLPTWLIYEPLTHYFPANGTYLPHLAENWTYQDYMVFTLKLRKGVKWHDGSEFNATDVWSTWYCIYLLKDRAWYYLKNITIADRYTLIFYMSEKNDYCPFYILWHWVALPRMIYGDIARRVYEKIRQGYNIFADESPFVDLRKELLDMRPERPIGTGPFKLKYVSETEIVLEKFEDYWRGIPDIDEIHLLRVTATDVAWQMLSEGQLDYHWAIPTKEQHDLMVNKPYWKIIGVPRPVGITLYFNNRPKRPDGTPNPLYYKEVRKAIAYAINRTEVAYVQYPAGATPAKYNVGFNPAGLYAALNESFIETWLKDFTYDYNPAKAEELLRSIGCTKGPDGIYRMPDGTKLEFTMKAAGYINLQAMEAIASQLEKVGIKVTPIWLDAAVFFAPEGDFYQGRYDIGVGVYGGASFSFDEYYHKYLHVYPGHGMNPIQKVPWREEPINVTERILYAQTYPAKCTLNELREIYAELSYITCSEVPVFTLYSPTAYIYLNVYTFGGWPDPNDLYWMGLGSYEAHGSSYLFRWLLIKPNFNLTISVTPSVGGTTTPAPGTARYTKGTSIEVAAAPASGYAFKEWRLDGKPAGTSPTITVTVIKNSILEAVFVPMFGLTISVTPSGGGTTTPAPGTYTYVQGDKVTVTASPAFGYNFKEWRLDGKPAGTSPTITVTIDAPHTLEAAFERIPYELYIGVPVAIIVIVVAVFLILRRRRAVKA
jgi:peptide/nickel transport system substrate-binding protein